MKHLFFLNFHNARASAIANQRIIFTFTLNSSISISLCPCERGIEKKKTQIFSTKFDYITEMECVCVCVAMKL